jgi:low affinity Fe/Cu permease
MVDSVCRRGKTAVFLVSLHRRARDANASQGSPLLDGRLTETALSYTRLVASDHDQGSTARSTLRSAIDRVTDALGHEFSFTVAAVAVGVWLVVGSIYGLNAKLVVLTMNVVTFVMVFAVQHTSSRESRALNVKMDELIRATAARNDLIGVETESHGELEERREQLVVEAEHPDPSASSAASRYAELGSSESAGAD